MQTARCGTQGLTRPRRAGCRKYFDEVPVLEGLKNFNAAKKYAVQKSVEEAGKLEVVMSGPGKSARPVVLVNGARPTSTLAVKKRGVKCALQGTR